MEELVETYCYGCGSPLLGVPIFVNNTEALFCNNSECNRFGLLTVLSLPNKPDEKKDKKDSNKGAKS